MNMLGSLNDRFQTRMWIQTVRKYCFCYACSYIVAVVAMISPDLPMITILMILILVVNTAHPSNMHRSLLKLIIKQKCGVYKSQNATVNYSNCNPLHLLTTCRASGLSTFQVEKRSHQWFFSPGHSKIYLTSWTYIYHDNFLYRGMSTRGTIRCLEAVLVLFVSFCFCS